MVGRTACIRVREALDNYCAVGTSYNDAARKDSEVSLGRLRRMFRVKSGILTSHSEGKLPSTGFFLMSSCVTSRPTIWAARKSPCRKLHSKSREYMLLGGRSHTCLAHSDPRPYERDSIEIWRGRSRLCCLQGKRWHCEAATQDRRE